MVLDFSATCYLNSTLLVQLHEVGACGEVAKCKVLALSKDVTSISGHYALVNQAVCWYWQDPVDVEDGYLDH